MSGTELVRTSRDGDQFHYHWAARQCLELLNPNADLKAVSIEGSSSDESDSTPIEDGDEIVDVGLYYGSEKLEAATFVHYIQLKHSTIHSETEWTGSGLRKTIVGFSKRYLALADEFKSDELHSRFRFTFLTNRPLAADVQQTLVELASGAQPSYPRISRLLTGYSEAKGSRCQEFFKIFFVDAQQPGLWRQRNLLTVDTSTYLSEADYDAPVHLKELVTQKALSGAESNPSIRRHDVLGALKVTEDQLYPAPNLIAAPAFELIRSHDAAVLQALSSTDGPLVVHADGGIGKSMLARRVADNFPGSSVAVVYDCFGDGLYRNSMNLRHRHVDALVQIANELSTKGLCHPLIPTSRADAKQLMRAFYGRLNQAISLLRANDANAMLCIIVDAADNAAMAAQERSEPSFVSDLVRAPLLAGVKLLFTCRTHRIHLLNAHPDVITLPLEPFTRHETATHLRQYHPEATDAEVEEFEHLSSANPRVQALALSHGHSLTEVLSHLGPNPTTVDRAIAELLKKAVAGVRDKVGPIEATQMDLICQGLAVLRPLVPISILASLSATSVEAVRSFAHDLGRPLLVKGDSLHFLDEPAETWFRENFRPDATQMSEILARLRPLTADSAYASSMLPQLLLAAGKLDELIELALSDQGLPQSNPLERRDVELQRLTFALKASLDGGRYHAAAKLALRAGGELAAETRQNVLVQENTDLVGQLMSADRIEEIVSRRSFSSSWMGSAQAYYAGLLSVRPELRAQAVSRIRVSMGWLEAWAKGPHDHSTPSVSDEDRAELVLAILRARSPAKASQFLRRWRPLSLSFGTGRLVARRLLDSGQTSELDSLATAARNNVWALLAIAAECAAAGHVPPAAPLARLLRLLAYRRVQLTKSEEWSNRGHLLEAVNAAVLLGLRVSAVARDKSSLILKKYLPNLEDARIADRFEGLRVEVLRSFSIVSAIENKPIRTIDLAPEKIRNYLNGKASKHTYSHEAEDFRRTIDPFLNLVKLSTQLELGASVGHIIPQVKSCCDSISKHEGQSPPGGPSLTQNFVVEFLRFVCLSGISSEELRQEFIQYFEQVKDKLYVRTLVAVCHRAARDAHLRTFAIEVASHTFDAIETQESQSAEERANDYQKLARAILPVNPSEASAYFDRGIEIASKIGEENLSRWDALLNLALRAGGSSSGNPELAYKLSRAAELTYEFVARDKHFDWHTTIEAIAGLCGPSALTISSRWRDRRFGSYGRLLPALVNQLVQKGGLPIEAPVVLGCIDGEWDSVDALIAAASAAVPLQKAQAILRLGYRYIRLGTPDGVGLRKLSTLAHRLNVELPDIDMLQRRAVQEAAIDRSSAPPLRSGDRETPPEPSWEIIYASVNFSDGASIREAYQRFRSGEPPYDLKRFFAEGIRLAGAATTPAYIRAVASWSSFDIYDLRQLLEALPPASRRLLSVKKALREVVLESCQREPIHVHLHGYYFSLPLKELETEGVVAREDVVASVLRGYARRIDDFNATQIFHLFDSLNSKLSVEEAVDALSFGIELLSGSLSEDRGDGEWTEALFPPPTSIDALAGYIWAGLASPSAALRWQFAHVVRSAVELDWLELLQSLTLRAEARIGGPFVDSRLEFYEWHARQWFVLGLARGALSVRRLPPECINYLWAEVESRHVLIRALAGNALSFTQAGDDLKSKSALASINTSTIPDEACDSWTEANEETLIESTESEAGLYRFGLDIGPYWFGPLGRAFGISETAITRRAAKSMRERMGVDILNRADDARYSRKVFSSYDRDTSHSHGSLPKTDDLTAYRSYHAMMFCASDLLEQRASRRYESSDKNEFQDWLSRQLLTFPQGFWLADRRDPEPHPTRNAPYGGDARQEWCWGVNADYLDSQLKSDDDMHVLWGYWGYGSSSDEETIAIRSALVPSESASALVAALQTQRKDELRLPASAESQNSLRESPEIQGWVVPDSDSSLLDEMDTWANGVSVPGPRPDKQTCADLELLASDDGRHWSFRQGGKLRSEAWSRNVGHGREAGTLTGSRLCADDEFVRRLLDVKSDSCLVISVSVRRLPGDSSGSDESVKYPLPYQRFYILNRDGITRSL